MVVSRLNKQTKAIALDNSSLFDIHKLSHYKEVDHVVNHLFKMLCEKNPVFLRKNASKNKSQLKTLIVNLYLNYVNDQKRFTSVYLKKSYYDDLEERYNQLYISKILIPLIHELVSSGYLIIYKGFYSLKKSKMTRIRGSSKLFNLFKSNKFHEFMIEDSDKQELIILRDEINGKQIDIPYNDDDHENIPVWRDNLKKYNELLKKTFIDIPQYSQSGIKLPHRKNKKQFTTIHLNQWDKTVQRIFSNGKWTDGGRFYGGWWQRIPSKYRNQIRFFNTPSSEIDYSGLHINLLYVIVNKKMTLDDPYTIPEIANEGFNRQIIKLILLNIINAEDDQKAIKAIRQKINFNEPLREYVANNQVDWESFIDIIKHAHSPIKDYFNTGKGIELQNFDSMIAEEVINEFTNQNIPILCIHDSFVISSQYVKNLEIVMKEKFDLVCEKLDLKSKGTKLKSDGLQDGLFESWLYKPEYKDTFIDNMIKVEFNYPVWAKKLELFKSIYKETHSNKLDPSLPHIDH